jgi:uncharacterized protein (UPF0332 family)
MPKNLTLKESFDKCSAEGNLILQDKVDMERIKSMIQNAEDDLESARYLARNQSPKYGSIFKLYYSVIHQLTEALLRFDNIKSYNHQCLFSALCTKHIELYLDWNFFEKIRTKRNGLEYYGTQILKNDWDELKLQFEVYGKTLLGGIKSKLQN